MFVVKVENKVLQGPKNDLNGFLVAVDLLHSNVEYLMLNRGLKASDTALNQARDLFAKGMGRLEEEFRTLLTNHRFEPCTCRIALIIHLLLDSILKHA